MKAHFDDDDPEIGRLATDLASHIARARANLLERMLDLGLSVGKGWRIAEEIRSSASGTVVFLRPIHVRYVSPDLEMTVQIGHDGRAV